MPQINYKQFIIIALIVSIWVNISEVFRYFVFVQPEMQTTLSMIPGVADINLSIFMIWGLWDTLLSIMITFIFWLCMKVFGNNTHTIIISGISSWVFFFVLFWVGTANMGLANWSFIPLPLSLALIETLVASIIASKLYKKSGM